MPDFLVAGWASARAVTPRTLPRALDRELTIPTSSGNEAGIGGPALTGELDPLAQPPE